MYITLKMDWKSLNYTQGKNSLVKGKNVWIYTGCKVGLRYIYVYESMYPFKKRKSYTNKIFDSWS